MNAQGTILIVDENKDLLKVLSAIISIMGVEIRTATNGLDAFDIINNEHVDLVLSSELLLLTQMRGMEQVTPFVYLCKADDSDNAIQALRSGAIDVINKPINPEILIRKMSKALEYGFAAHQIEREVSNLYLQHDLSISKRLELQNIKRSIRMMAALAQIYKRKGSMDFLLRVS